MKITLLPDVLSGLTGKAQVWAGDLQMNGLWVHPANTATLLGVIDIEIGPAARPAWWERYPFDGKFDVPDGALNRVTPEVRS